MSLFGLFEVNKQKAEWRAQQLAVRADAISKLSDNQLTMFALCVMVDGAVFDEQVLDEMTERAGQIPTHPDDFP